jgi:alginate O-acetyltransferase complex protein AlgI
VLWGAYHGVFLIFDRLFLNRFTKPIGKLGRVVLTFFLVMLGWVLFRSENFAEAMTYYTALFSFDFSSVHLFVSAKFYRVLAIAILLSFLFLFNRIAGGYQRFVDSVSISSQLSKTIVGVFLISVSVANLAGSGFNPFIYFRF